MTFNLEVSALVIFFVTQLIGFGKLTQKLQDLGDAMLEEKLERKKLAEKVQALEVRIAPLAMVRKAGQ
jgi:hypothetical protein